MKKSKFLFLKDNTIIKCFTNRLLNQIVVKRLTYKGFDILIYKHAVIKEKYGLAYSYKFKPNTSTKKCFSKQFFRKDFIKDKASCIFYDYTGDVNIFMCLSRAKRDIDRLHFQTTCCLNRRFGNLVKKGIK
jgi:hypothetical protein